jgi:DNA polymerase-3 subunit delta'
LDGSGATAAAVADELIGFLDASVEPLKTRHALEMTELLERNERAAQVVGSGRSGKSAKAGGRAVKAALNAGVSQLEERHKRELRRQRTDELRCGLAALASAYRQRLAAGPDPRRQLASIEAVGHIDKLSRDLTHNPGELLAVQALLVRLGQSALRG